MTMKSAHHLPKPSVAPQMRRWLSDLLPHLILGGYSIFATFPIFMILINSFKTRKAIFGAPFELP
ncbi:MAG: hypothetical protein U1B80_07395, partial [Anaerolineaceae bacterium]|nr:hypothetical protein [Anaerolineaceae bacterium]